MEVVLRAVVRSMKGEIRARFRFIGTSREEEARLRLVDGVEQLVENTLVQFHSPLPRNDIPAILADCDIGLSLIPPKAVYYESSPTKLAEYMGAGLAVLATRGIPMQERVVTEADCGLLVNWDEEAIALAIKKMAANPKLIRQYGEKAQVYAKKSLRYRCYLPQFRKLLGLS
jgi:glycosyltransferase involved in cell wall biosynthesis